ncbi:MAG: type II secretion system F family protein [Candidatus Diapherotrites archaeon]|uniref:Type II secretion system F family protein n=1 Tax=Candidatus Iainarchaeum sp. TaxID=3101447 RepID=A0A939C9Q9_9ARCH|nr:type II secretion system F family protein [Candidatus Diapherotrites archaeon]
MKKIKIQEMLAGKEAKHSALVALFAWFVSGLLLESIIAGLLFCAAAFLASMAAMLYWPELEKKNYGRRVEAGLPFILLNIAIELNLGIGFMQCMRNAAGQKGQAGSEFRKAVDAVEKKGAAVNEALLGIAKRAGNRQVNRSIAQLAAAAEQGSSGKPGEPIKRIALEMLARQKIESRLFSGKLVVLSLLFIAVSAVFPALFQSFALVGSMVLKMSITGTQAFLIIALGFPALNIAMLLYIRSKTPLFLRG